MSLFFFWSKIINKNEKHSIFKGKCTVLKIKASKIDYMLNWAWITEMNTFSEGVEFFQSSKDQIVNKKAKRYFTVGTWVRTWRNEGMIVRKFKEIRELCVELNNRSFFSPFVHLNWVNLSIFKGLRNFREKKTPENTVFLNKSVLHFCSIESTSSKMLPENGGKPQNRTLNFRGKCVCD